MARTLILPDRMAPSNLHLRPTVKTRFVENDVFDICNRIKAIDPNLYVIELIEGDKAKFAIMERCADGVERLIYRVDELDGRVVERLRYLAAVPLQERLAALEKDEHEFEAERKDNELEELYENLGRDMWQQLEHDGFSGPRGVSYAKRGVTGGRGSARRS